MDKAKPLQEIESIDSILTEWRVKQLKAVSSAMRSETEVIVRSQAIYPAFNALNTSIRPEEPLINKDIAPPM